jgi:predicted lactoylglutathione lyase
MKLGKYAHISISVRSLRESSPFYKGLGFEKLFDSAHPRPWELLTDGCVNIHLYESYFISPALHYFSATMDETIVHLKRIGITPELQRSKDGSRQQHNFSDPNDFWVMLMHHNENTMPVPEGISRCVLGTFGEMSIGTDNLKAATFFWDKIGFRQTMKSNKPYGWAAMSDDVMKIGLHQTATFSAPALTYFAADVRERIGALRERKISVAQELKGSDGHAEGALISAPDGQLFFLLSGRP